MPNLLDLANETLLSIIDYVSGHTAEELSSTCRLLNNLTRDKMRIHKQKKQTLSTVTFESIHEFELHDPRMLRYLRQIFDDEEYALYPRKLVLGTEGSTFMPWGESDDDDEDGDIDGSFEDRMKAAILQRYQQIFLKASPAAGARDWQSLMGGYDNLRTFVFLIYLLPDLEILTIDPFFFGNPQEEGRFMNRFEWISKSLRQERMPALSKLREIRFSGFCEEGGIWKCTALSVFLSNRLKLPSLRKLIFKSVYSENLVMPSKQCAANISTIGFFQSSIAGHKMRMILSSAAGLRGFTYSFKIAHYPHEWTECLWEPRLTVEALHEFSRATLEYLNLTACIDWERDEPQLNFNTHEPCIGSLRSFICLRSVRLQMSTLYKEVEDAPFKHNEHSHVITGRNRIPVSDIFLQGSDWLVEPQRLVDIMPASLERLELVGGVDIEDGRYMLSGLSELKEERVPKLRTIIFKDNDEFDNEMIEDCEKAGIALSCWGPDGYRGCDGY
ncbi:hypothetical protein ACLMJK_007984 [Lecanora helva]